MNCEIFGIVLWKEKEKWKNGAFPTADGRRQCGGDGGRRPAKKEDVHKGGKEFRRKASHHRPIITSRLIRLISFSFSLCVCFSVSMCLIVSMYVYILVSLFLSLCLLLYRFFCLYAHGYLSLSLFLCTSFSLVFLSFFIFLLWTLLCLYVYGYLPHLSLSLSFCLCFSLSLSLFYQSKGYLFFNKTRKWKWKVQTLPKRVMSCLPTHARTHTPTYIIRKWVFHRQLVRKQRCAHLSNNTHTLNLLGDHLI